MYDLNRKEVVQKFKGHKQQIYLIKCDFGGVNESFVVAGSEDAFIYLWNKEKGDHIAKIGGEKGHTQVVNQISWNPTDSFLFASASDDQTIRIWGKEDMPMADVQIDRKEIKKVSTSS